MGTDFSIEEIRRDTTNYDELCDVRESIIQEIVTHQESMEELGTKLANYDLQINQIIEKHQMEGKPDVQITQVLEEVEMMCDSCGDVLGYCQIIDPEMANTACPDCKKEYTEEDTKMCCTKCRMASN